MFTADAAKKKLANSFTSLTLLSVIAIGSSATAQVQGPVESVPSSMPLNFTPTVGDNYRLGPGDRIRLNNLEGPEFSGDHQIAPDGTISLPLIGAVNIQGLTLQQATDLIIARYTRFYKYPQVSIYIQAIGPLEIVTAGEIRFPGRYVLSREDQTRHRGIQLPTLLDAIIQSGGITLTGNPRQIEVRRRQPTGSEQVITVDLWNFLRTGDRSENVTLQDGDTIFVPTETDVNLAQKRELAIATFATDINTPRTIAVVGEVTRPGSYVIQGGDTQLDRRSDGLPTVIQAIQLAGGITLSADIQQVQIRRISKTGSEITFEVNLWQFFQNGDITQDTIVQEGDIISIPTATTANLAQMHQLSQTSVATDLTQPRTVNVVGDVFRPGPYVLKTRDPLLQTVDGLPTVTRAIQLAGGIKPTANLRLVQIRRLTRAGAEQIINVDLWQLLQTGDLIYDPILAQGDTLVIPTMTDVNPAEAAEVATASFSPETMTVYVVGEGVGSRNLPPRPELELPPNTPISQAILASGAFDKGRASNSVQLIRLNSNGTVSQQSLEVDFTAGINEQTNPLLRDKDIIVVRQTGGSRVTDTLQSIGESALLIPRIETLLRIFSFLGIIENRSFDGTSE